MTGSNSSKKPKKKLKKKLKKKPTKKAPSKAEEEEEQSTMSKTAITMEGQVGIKSMLQEGVVHRYVLNDVKAIKMMVTNAGLPPLTPEVPNPQSTKLQLSTGAFSQVLQPMFRYWNEFNLEQGQRLMEGETEVILKNVRFDTEETGKNVDGLAQFTFQSTNISVFAYFTNTSAMVQGVHHKEFLDRFLAPILVKTIKEKKTLIEDFNTKVKYALQTKSSKPDQNDSVWSCVTPDRSTLNMKLRRIPKCDVCGRTYPSVSHLKIHMTNAHSESTRAKPRAANRTSRQLVTSVSKSISKSSVAINQDIIDLNSSDDEDTSLAEVVPRQASPCPSPPLMSARIQAPKSTSTAAPPTSTLEAPLQEAGPPSEDPLNLAAPPLEAHQKPAGARVEAPLAPVDRTRSSSFPGVGRVLTPPAPPMDPLAPILPSYLLPSSKIPLPVTRPLHDQEPVPRHSKEINVENDETETKSDDDDVEIDSEVENVNGTKADKDKVEIVAEVEKENGTKSNEADVEIVSGNEKENGRNKNKPKQNKDTETLEFQFVCAVCGKGFNSTHKALRSHVESHSQADSVIALMKTINVLTNKYEKQEQEILNLKKELQYTRRGTQGRRITTPAPASQPPPPAPGSPPSIPGPSSTLTPSDHQQVPHNINLQGGERMSPTPPPTRQEVRQHPPTFHPAPRPKGKVPVLHLVDSVNRAVIYPELEKATGCSFRTKTAYSSEFDERAKKPKKNVNAVLRQQLGDLKNRNIEIHTVVLGSPTVDITNQFIENGLVDENVSEVVASAHNMVEAAEYALSSGQAKQVVLLQHPPRYDSEEEDPEGVMPRLAMMANEKMQEARDASVWAKHILVGEHSGLECDGATHFSRFTSDHTFSRNKNIRMGKYDGVHMYSLEGAKAMTKSILSILNRAGLTSAAHRGVRREKMSSYSSSTSPYSSNLEEQQEYISPWLNPPVDRGFLGNLGRQEKQQQQFNLPTSNRFSGFY